jgi:uncharacterized protein with GYD domain
MIKFVTLLTLTEKGLAELPHSAKHFAEIEKIVQDEGGHLLVALATTGAYDFVSVVEYPTPEAAFAARVKIAETGLMKLESLDAFDIQQLFAVA